LTRSPARLLKPSEVARLFDVEVSTVVEWARIGKIPALKTPGGQQYRFNPATVMALLEPIVITDGKSSNDFEPLTDQTGDPEAS